MAGTGWLDATQADPTRSDGPPSDKSGPSHRRVVDRDWISIEQSGLKQAGNLVLSISGGLSFLAVAVVLGADQPLALVVFGFFGVFMLLGGVVAARRGTDRRLIDVNPDGIWLPEMGRLGWADIREARLETIRGVGGDGEQVVPYRRLGVVPLDPDLKPAVATRIAWGMFDGYARFLKGLARGIRFGAEDRAPFTFGEPEARRDQLDAVLAVVGRYVEVVDAASERARQHAPRWAAHAAAGESAGAAADLAALDARLGAGAASGARAAPGARPAPGARATLVPIQSQGQPAAVFRTPPLGPRLILEALLGLLPVVGFFLFLYVGFEGHVTGINLVFLLLILAVFLGPTLVRFGPRALETIRRSRMSDEDRTVLRVGPAGIWMRGMGTVAWDRVRGVRARVSGTSPVGVGGQIPRWGLFVEPDDGRAAREWPVFADELDEPFDDVLDLVRYYHPVDDR